MSEAWEITVRWGEAPLARLAHALIECRGQVCDSFAMGKIFPTPKGVRGMPVDIMMLVKIQDGTSERFKALCKPVEMLPPTQVHLNSGGQS